MERLQLTPQRRAQRALLTQIVHAITIDPNVDCPALRGIAQLNATLLIARQHVLTWQAETVSMAGADQCELG